MVGTSLVALPPLRDRIRPGVRVLFVGINPGIRSSLTGHHFAGFSNRFWKLLYESRLVPEPIGHEDDGLRVLRALEEEGWMKVLCPAWTANKCWPASTPNARRWH